MSSDYFNGHWLYMYDIRGLKLETLHIVSRLTKFLTKIMTYDYVETRRLKSHKIGLLGYRFPRTFRYHLAVKEFKFMVPR